MSKASVSRFPPRRDAIGHRVAGRLGSGSRATTRRPIDRKEDVVYGRKYGSALTMDVFTPKANANGAAVIWVVSGGWYSSHEWINLGLLDELL